jgi:TonB family protein
MLVLWACVAKLAVGEQRALRGPGSRLHCNPTMKLRKLVRPIYPPEALLLGIRGTVTVELLIDKQGAPRNIHVAKGDAALASSVLKAVQRWRWQPYRINREAVAVEMTIAVNFEPANEGAPSSEAFTVCRW